MLLLLSYPIHEVHKLLRVLALGPFPRQCGLLDRVLEELGHLQLHLQLLADLLLLLF